MRCDDLQQRQHEEEAEKKRVDTLISDKWHRGALKSALIVSLSLPLKPVNRLRTVDCLTMDGGLKAMRLLRCARETLSEHGWNEWTCVKKRRKSERQKKLSIFHLIQWQWTCWMYLSTAAYMNVRQLFFSFSTFLARCLMLSCVVVDVVCLLFCWGSERLSL